MLEKARFWTRRVQCPISLFMDYQSFRDMKIKDLPVIGITVDVKIPTENGATTIGAIVPIGAISMYGGRFAPENWAMCDGSTLSIQGNEPLFAVIGNAFGGENGVFSLPNFSGRFPFGTAAGVTGGAAAVTLTTAQMPAHSHPVTLTGAQVSINTTVTGTIKAGATASGNFPATTVPITGGEVTIPVSTATRGNDQTSPSQGVLAPTTTAFYKSTSTPNEHYKENGTLINAVANIPQTTLNLSVSGLVNVPIQTTAPVTGTASAESAGAGQPVSIVPPFLGIGFIIRAR